MSVAEYTVRSVREGKVTDNPHGGKLQAFYVDFAGPDNKLETGCYWRRKEGNAPVVGESYHGEITEGDHGARFKQAQGNFPPREASTATAGGQSFKPKSDDVQRQIIRQHSQEMALRLLTANGALQDGGTTASMRAVLKEWTDHFDQDVLGAGQAARAEQGLASPPPPVTPAPPSPPADDAHQWFCKLLDTAGVETYPAGKLADFITNKFNDAQRKKAENGLSDLDTQGTTVKALIAAYEKAEGPLPEDDPADADLPF